VLDAMEAQDRLRLEQVLVFEEDTAGGLMNLDTISVRADVSVEVVMRYLRRLGEIPRGTNRLMVVDRENRYVGTIRLADLLTHESEEPINSLLLEDIVAIPAYMEAADVARLFEQRNFISAPVVDEDGKLLGRVTIDDVVDVIRDEGERSFMQRAGLHEDDDLFAPVGQTARRRLFWLGINLLTAFIAAAVIGQFEATIQEIVALAVLMPIVASMGGIAGTQTLTVAVRGMALGQLGSHNTPALIVKEVLVAIINGLVWSCVVALIAGWWFGSWSLAVVVGIALMINVLVASVSGASLPVILQRMSIDPALAGGVVLTTVTDVVGFLAILGLGAAVLTA
jgi:magnesium transporter